MPRHITDNEMDAKGDLMTATADNTPAVLSVGADATIITADSSAAKGIKWAAPATQTTTTSLTGTSSTPALVLGAAAGSGATSSIVGTNLGGKITLNSGTGVLGSGTVMTMTFANSLSYANGCSITFTAGNSNFASVLAVLSASSTQTTVVLTVAVALSVSTQYIGFYQILGY